MKIDLVFVCFALLFLTSASVHKKSRRRMKRRGDELMGDPAALSSEAATTTTATAATTATTAAAVSTPRQGSNNFTHIIDLLGPRKKVDVVFILARSRAIGKRTFYEKSRLVMRSLLQLYATVHEDFARVAVVSYARNASVDYDNIRGPGRSLDKCQLFPTEKNAVFPSFPLDVVKYVMEDEQGDCGIYDAYVEAREIFKAGKSTRPEATQVAVLLSDAVTNCPIQDLALDTTAVKVFGVGLGAFLNEWALNAFVSSPYQLYVARLDSWLDITERVRSIKRDSTPMYKEIPGLASCGQTADSKCYCDIDNGVVKACKSESHCAPASPDISCLNPGDDRCLDGTCLDIPGGVVCYCREGFYGKTCQHYADPCRFSDICDKINGVCWGNPDNGGQFRCNCTPAYEGDFCQDLKPTTATTPVPKNVTRIVTILLSVTPIPFDASKSIILGSVFGGLILLAIIIGIILCAVCYIRRRKILRQEHLYKEGVRSSNAGVQSTITSWPSKYSTISSRLSQLFYGRPFGEGMPSVPNRFSASLSAMDMQNVSQEETVYKNEIIHDNRQILTGWKSYLDELVSKSVAEKAVMANVSSKEAASTENWIVDWSELNALWSGFGSDAFSAGIQGMSYALRRTEADYMTGEELYSPKFACLGRTDRYLVVALGDLSQDEGREECMREVQFIIKHIKSEGF